MKIKFILAQMSKVYKPQRQFIIILLTTFMCLRGKANFRMVDIVTVTKRPTHVGFVVILILLSSITSVLNQSVIMITH